MSWEKLDKKTWSPWSLVDFMKNRWLNSSFSERGKLFSELMGSEERYKWTMKQNIQLLSKLKIDHLSSKIVPPKQIEKTPPKDTSIVNCARKYLWHPFDTSENGIDGGWLKSWEKTWKAKLKDNFTWEIYVSDKKPFVCAGLVTTSIEDAGIISLPKKEDPYYWHRVENIEKLAKSNPDLFTIYTLNSTSWNITWCAVWDIITLVITWHWRHCGIVTEVDKDWRPTKVINSRFEWVIESQFLSTENVWIDYNQRTRYNGFFTAENKNAVRYVIRPKVDNILLAQNKRQKEG